MRIGIPKESKPGETLVAATPATAAQLIKLGYEVVVESGAGVGADQPDVAYEAQGARMTSADEVWGSDVVAKINAPSDDEIGRLHHGSIVVSMNETRKAEITTEDEFAQLARSYNQMLDVIVYLLRQTQREAACKHPQAGKK